jgi:uncharacterized protein YijF (DUF1287 family)
VNPCWIFLLPLLLLPTAGCRPSGAGNAAAPGGWFNRPDPLALNPSPRTAADRIVNGAKLEARRGVQYDAAYVRIAYPGGDVPADRGACTDVVVRALRHAGYDLQKLIHEDMQRRFSQYPRRYGLKRPDPNIDHRRTPNQVTFLKRFGRELPKETTGAAAKTWQPGDLVYWELPGGIGHCGVLSDVRGPSGLPLAIHNIGETAQEDCLTAWKITGHYRYPRTNESSSSS